MRTADLLSPFRLASHRTLAVVSMAVTAALLTGCSVAESGNQETAASHDEALNANEKAAYDYFVGKGLQNFQAAGIVGNLIQESNVDPNAVQAGGPGRGIAQWSVGGRWDTAIAYAQSHGQSVYSLNLQLDFIWHELTTGGYGFSDLKASTSLSSATVIFENKYEICGNCQQASRISYAQQVLNAFGGDQPTVQKAPTIVELAFQANTTSLWTVGDAGNKDWGLGMMPGTSPSITALHNGGFEVAFQANTGSLWTVGSAGNKDWGLGMMNGTSPAITALANGGFEVAFQANTGSLWTVGNAGNRDWSLGMMKGSSPSIAAVGNGFEVAFEANTTSLWTVGDAGNKDWSLGMMSGTSPSITGLANGGFEVAFEANTTSLWTVGNAGNKDWGLGMMSGTSPSITGLVNGGFEVAFEANTTSLWTVGNAGNKDWGLGMMSGTSPTISATADGSFRASFQANTGSLWSVGSGGQGDLHLGMKAGTNPGGT